MTFCLSNFGMVCVMENTGGNMVKIISDRLKKELAIRGISIAEFAEMCDLPLETMKNIYYGKTVDPKISTVSKIADALGISVDCLTGHCSHTQEEKDLMINYRACGNHGKSVILLVSKYEATSAKNERESVDKHKIPCLILSGNIRQGIIYDRCETVEIETTVPEAYVGIEMPNNDLAPIYCKGDVILIENRFPNDGECAMFFKGDRAYIKKYIEEDGQYRLKCLHSMGEDMVFKRMDQINYVGTCIDVIRS